MDFPFPGVKSLVPNGELKKSYRKSRILLQDTIKGEPLISNEYAI